MKYVVDASVILKSLLKEDTGVAEYFEKLLRGVENEKVEILSHSLIVLEVANGFRFTTKDKELSIELYKAFLRLPIKVLNLTKAQQEKTLNLAYDLGTTVYDTSYHVLAKSHGGTFLTCDDNYFKKARVLGGIEFIE